jgi:hypothetical protein
VDGQTPPKQSGTHNFILDEFSGGTFPFAINQCTAISIPASKWYKYTCMQEDNQWTVVKTSYSDDSCSGTGKVLHTYYYNQTNATNSFECDGINSFAKIGISVSSDCSSSVTFYAGLTGCATATTGGTSQFEFFCNSSVAFVEFFRTSLNQSTNQTMSTTGAPMSTTGAPMSTTGAPMSTTSGPMSTTALGLTSTSNANLTNTKLNNTQSTTAVASSTAIPVTTGILVTAILSSTMVSGVQQTCLSNDYCEVWILPSGKCSYANVSNFRSSQIKIYGKLLECNENSTGATGGATTTSTVQPTKSALRLQVAITVVFTLLLATSWI